MAGVSPPRLPLALTMGEPAGIGPDITLMVWTRRRELRLPAFYCLGDAALLADRARALGLECPIAETDAASAAAAFANSLPVAPLAAPAAAVAGAPDPANAPAVIEAITRAVEDVEDGVAAAVVTNPISKRTLRAAGFAHPGHTEFLAALSEARTGAAVRPVMMLAGPELRTVPVTIHVPLRDVPSLLSEALIVETARIVAADLQRRFALPNPRLAIAGLNPHAGEGGTIGDEDELIVAPAVAALKRGGIDVAGPIPADTMFHAAARARYDAALCMYHDQALIPVKTLAFAETVNVTLGLPFARTSPDHGTAFDIAGTGRADPTSLAAALALAARLRANELAA